MDDAALLELPDDPIILKRMVIERDEIITQRDEAVIEHKQIIIQRDEAIIEHKQLIAQRERLIIQRDESIQLLSQDNQLLRHRLAALLRSSYGPRSERFDPRQLLLFGLLVPPIEPAAQKLPRDKSQSTHRHKHGRQKLPGHLARVPIEHDLSDQEKNCPCCGQERVRIGQEKSEQLEHVPANFVVLEHIRHKYACPHCNSGKCHKCDGNAQIDIAVKPAEGVEKCLPGSTRSLLAGPGLLAYVATSKLADHLPLYRIEQIFCRQKVHLSRSTMSGWMNAAAKLVEPLYQLMCDRVRQSQVLHTDDTTVPVQSEGHCRQGRLWTYVGDEHNPYIVYDYTPTRSAQGPLAWLGKWKGFLQADAYAGYDKLYARGDVSEVACWAHVRRKFFDAQESDPARALWMLEMIRRLYAVEGEASTVEDEATQDRLSSRQSRAAPILEQIRLWLTSCSSGTGVLPKSPIAQAIGYALNQWPALVVYTTDARLSIDNNVAERALRRVAVGRKNWLFAGHDESAQGQAVLWSLIASAQRHELDVQLYLRSVLAHLPAVSLSNPPGLDPARPSSTLSPGAPGSPTSDELHNYLPDVWRRDRMAEQQAALNAYHGRLLGARSATMPL